MKTVIKSTCAIVLAVFSLSAYAIDPPTTWENDVDGVYYSDWYYVGGVMPGPITYRSEIHDGNKATVTVYFDDDYTYVSAKEIGINTCLYSGDVDGARVSGTVICGNNPAHNWSATMSSPPQKIEHKK